jgi:hypothetical protein
VGRKLEKNRKANVQFVSGTADFLFSFFSFWLFVVGNARCFVYLWLAWYVCGLVVYWISWLNSKLNAMVRMGTRIWSCEHQYERSYVFRCAPPKT